jgi:Major Facilitator Superfamily
MSLTSPTIIPIVTDRTQHSTIISAVEFLPVCIASIIVMGILGPYYNHRFLPPKYVLIAGEVIAAAGVVLYSRNEINTSYWRFSFPGLILLSIGLSGFFINYLNIAFASAPPEDQGLISGILQTVAQLATALAFAIASSLISAKTPEGLLPQYRNSFYISIACAGLAAIVSVIFLSPIKPEEGSKVRDEEKVLDEESTASSVKEEVTGA